MESEAVTGKRLRTATGTKDKGLKKRKSSSSSRGLGNVEFGSMCRAPGELGRVRDLENKSWIFER